MAAEAAHHAAHALGNGRWCRYDVLCEDTGVRRPLYLAEGGGARRANDAEEHEGCELHGRAHDIWKLLDTSCICVFGYRHV